MKRSLSDRWVPYMGPPVSSAGVVRAVLLGVESDVEPGDSVCVADAVRYPGWNKDKVAGANTSFRSPTDGGTTLTIDWIATFVDDLSSSYEGA